MESFNEYIETCSDAKFKMRSGKSEKNRSEKERKREKTFQLLTYGIILVCFCDYFTIQLKVKQASATLCFTFLFLFLRGIFFAKK